MNAALPTGRAGRLLALGITLVGISAVWLAVAAPLLDWYAERAEHLQARGLLARRMESVAETLPELRRLAAGPRAQAPAAASLLDGATDAIAAAALQQTVQDMAGRVGATLSSTEVLPASQAGAYRRIGLHVAVSAPYAVLVHLLEAIALASPRMLTDDLQLHGSRLVVQTQDPPLDAAFTVIAFRAGTSPQ